MKFFLLSLLFINFLWAEDPCDSNLENTVPGISEALSRASIPNCLISENVDKAESGSVKKLCKCKNDFIEKNPPIEPLNKETLKYALQVEFFDGLMREYAKNATNQLVELAKIRILPNTPGGYSESLIACKIKSTQELAKGCSSPIAAKLLQNSKALDSLSNGLANEMALIMDKGTLPKGTKGILDRSSKINSCGMSEEEVLLLSNAAVENYLVTSVIPVLNNSTDISIEESLPRLFEKKQFDDKLEKLISRHPYLSLYSKSSKDFINFIKKFDGKTDIESFRKILYNDDSGKAFDKKFAANCTQSLKNLTDAICSQDFEQGNLILDPFSNIKQFLDVNELEDSGIAHSAELREQNRKILQFCDMTPPEKGKDYAKIANDVTPSLDDVYKGKDTSTFKEFKYTAEFRNQNEEFCSIKEKPNCQEGTISCFMAQSYDRLKNNPQSYESKMMSSSNPEANKLIAGFIGNGSSALSPGVRKFLTDRHVLPDANGKLSPPPAVAERNPQRFVPSSSERAQLPDGNGVKTQAKAPERSGERRESYGTNFSHTGNSTSALEGMKFSKEEEAQYSDFDKEAMKGLMERMSRLKSAPDQRAVANEAVEKYHRSKGLPLSPQRREQWANRVMRGQEFNQMAQIPDKNKAGLDPGLSEKEQWAEEQKIRALAGMQGAQGGSDGDSLGGDGTGAAGAKGGRTPASENGEVTGAQGAVVALNIPEEQMKQGLSGLLSESQRQEIRTLLQSKKDFVLQLNGTSYKVNFDQTTKTFRVSQEKGKNTMTAQLENLFNNFKV